MNSRKIRHQIYTTLPTRRFPSLVPIVFILYLLTHLTGSSNSRPQQSPEDAARFLYRSPFRENPDLTYERKLSHALQKIEQTVLAQNNGKKVAEDRIWQIAKDEEHRGSDSTAFEQRNPDWTYTLVTDTKAISFITNELSAVPEIAAAYTTYPHNVLRADLLRYLLLWYYGGFYADMDVFPAKPIKECPALHPLFASSLEVNDEDTDTNNQTNVSFVVGIELDEPYATPHTMREWHWTRSYGFLQYIMYAPRRFSPILREIIVRSLSHTKQHNERYWGFFRRLRYTEKAILGVTGPDVFTDAILDVLSSSLPSTHPLVRQSVDADVEIGDLVSVASGKTEGRVTWAPFYRLTDTVCVDAGEVLSSRRMGGLCVLPVTAWGNGQRHSQSVRFDSPLACLNHRFGRTWAKGKQTFG